MLQCSAFRALSLEINGNNGQPLRLKDKLLLPLWDHFATHPTKIP